MKTIKYIGILLLIISSIFLLQSCKSIKVELAIEDFDIIYEIDDVVINIKDFRLDKIILDTKYKDGYKKQVILEKEMVKNIEDINGVGEHILHIRYHNVEKDLKIVLYDETFLNEYGVYIIDQDNLKLVIVKKIGDMISVDHDKIGELEPYAWEDEEGNVYKDYLPSKQATKPQKLNIVYSIFKKQHEVLFMFDDIVLKREMVKDGKSATPPSVPKIIGKTFVKWDQDFSKIKSDLIIKAIFTEEKYKITFIVDDKIYHENMLNYNDTFEYPLEPSKEGYYFIGWTSIPLMITKDTTCEAVFEKKQIANYYDPSKTNILFTCEPGQNVPLEITEAYQGEYEIFWEVMNVSKYEINYYLKLISNKVTNYYNVSFMLNNDCIKSETVHEGENATAPSIPKIMGKTFIKWDQDFTNITSDLIVKAIFEDEIYKVTFMVDQEVYAESFFSYGKEFEYPLDPVKKGYNFICWTNLPLLITQDIVLEAVFETVLITNYYDIDQETILYTCEQGETVPLEVIDKYTEDFDIFWEVMSINENGINYVIHLVNKNIDIYYKVIFSLNNEVIKEDIVKEGEDASPPVIPSLSGIVFVGWDSEYTNVTSNIEVKALLKPITIKVFFSFNDYKLEQVLFNYGDELIYPEEEPYLENSRFVKWSVEEKTKLYVDTYVWAVFLPIIGIEYYGPKDEFLFTLNEGEEVPYEKIPEEYLSATDVIEWEIVQYGQRFLVYRLKLVDPYSIFEISFSDNWQTYTILPKLLYKAYKMYGIDELFVSKVFSQRLMCDWYFESTNEKVDLAAFLDELCANNFELDNHVYFYSIPQESSVINKSNTFEYDYIYETNTYAVNITAREKCVDIPQTYNGKTISTVKSMVIPDPDLVIDTIFVPAIIDNIQPLVTPMVKNIIIARNTPHFNIFEREICSMNFYPRDIIKANVDAPLKSGKFSISESIIERLRAYSLSQVKTDKLYFWNCKNLEMDATFIENAYIKEMYILGNVRLLNINGKVNGRIDHLHLGSYTETSIIRDFLETYKISEITILYSQYIFDEEYFKKKESEGLIINLLEHY